MSNTTKIIYTIEFKRIDEDDEDSTQYLDIGFTDKNVAWSLKKLIMENQTKDCIANILLIKKSGGNFNKYTENDFVGSRIVEKGATVKDVDFSEEMCYLNYIDRTFDTLDFYLWLPEWLAFDVELLNTTVSGLYTKITLDELEEN